MFAPLRSVMSAHCVMGDMGEMDASTGNTVMPVLSDMSHDMSAMLSTDSMPSAMTEHDCCDDPSFNCSAACDLGVNISLVFQQTSYVPVYKDSFKVASLSSKTLFRELTPPSRPPASFHS